MSTTKEDCALILDQINFSGDITARPMMGEYLVYYRGVLVGGIYDGELLIKETPGNAGHGLERRLPYASAKRTMYIVDYLEDFARIQGIIETAYVELKDSQPKRRPKKPSNSGA